MQAMKLYGGNGGVAPHILNFGTKRGVSGQLHAPRAYRGTTTLRVNAVPTALSRLDQMMLKWLAWKWVGDIESSYVAQLVVVAASCEHSNKHPGIWVLLIAVAL